MKLHHNYFVYILANRTNKVLYIGVTNDLRRRIYEHRAKLVPGFTSRYNLYKLLYYEYFKKIENAILRERRLKKWKRTWKEELINNNLVKKTQKAE